MRQRKEPNRSCYISWLLFNDVVLYRFTDPHKIYLYICLPSYPSVCLSLCMCASLYVYLCVSVSLPRFTCFISDYILKSTINNLFYCCMLTFMCGCLIYIKIICLFLITKSILYKGCRDPYWGRHCEKDCGHCTYVCDKINGSCICSPGFKPPLCVDGMCAIRNSG